MRLPVVTPLLVACASTPAVREPVEGRTASGIAYDVRGPEVFAGVVRRFLGGARVAGRAPRRASTERTYAPRPAARVPAVR
jgi:hypothetical protein